MVSSCDLQRLFSIPRYMNLVACRLKCLLNPYRKQEIFIHYQDLWFCGLTVRHFNSSVLYAAFLCIVPEKPFASCGTVIAFFHGVTAQIYSSRKFTSVHLYI